MSTMAEAVRNYIESVSQATADDIKRAINSKYPNQWKPSTLQAHLYACAVNNPKAYIHHPFTAKFLYKNSDGTFEMYDEVKHGPNEWTPPEGADEETELTELAETSISLERDIEDHLITNLAAIEDGLTFVQRQLSTDVGRIDIMAKDKDGKSVVIEIKVGEAKDSSVGQIARYLGWFAKTERKATRGILIASDFPQGVRYAAAAIPNLKLITYKVHFSFQVVSV
jgi:RecB family endonuclease NucS